MALARNKAPAGEPVSLLSLQVPPVAIGYGTTPAGLPRLDALIEQPRRARDIDATVAAYAADDGRRFGRARG